MSIPKYSTCTVTCATTMSRCQCHVMIKSVGRAYIKKVQVKTSQIFVCQLQHLSLHVVLTFMVTLSAWSETSNLSIVLSPSHACGCAYFGLSWPVDFGPSWHGTKLKWDRDDFGPSRLRIKLTQTEWLQTELTCILKHYYEIHTL